MVFEVKGEEDMAKIPFGVVGVFGGFLFSFFLVLGKPGGRSMGFLGRLDLGL